MRVHLGGVLAVLAFAAALALLPMIASGAGGSPPTISGLESIQWSPMEVTISPGGTVGFQNTSHSVRHGVVWKSGPETPHCEGVPIDEGQTNWSGTCTFSKEGVYEFYCYVHGLAMSGKVIVGSGGTTTTTTTTSSSSSRTSSTSTSSTSTHSSTLSTSSTRSMSSTSMAMGGSSGGSSGGTGTGMSMGSGSEGFLAGLKIISHVASTVPSNGDLNPYGIAMVQKSLGKLHAGDLLISNFNNKANEQGTGTTIEQISPAGTRSLFASLKAKALPGRCPGGVGLTTALSVLPHGFVVVGSLPTTNGKSATAKFGCLIVLNDLGRPVETIAGPRIQGPWDMTAVSKGAASTLFLSNVLNGGAAKGRRTIDNSTVLRIELNIVGGRAPKVSSEQVIAKGIPWRDSPEALVVGPTGVALSANGTLYLANTLANSITAIPHALSRTSAVAHGGRVVSKGGLLQEPLGLALAPDGDILTTNAGNGNIVETTPAGKQISAATVDVKTGAGSLFGLLVSPGAKDVYFVDDGENALNLLH